MRAVIQRVKNAWITVNQGQKQTIEEGLVVLFGVSEDDTNELCEKVAKKISDLRIFEDSQGKMNLSAKELNYDCLVVSQFTLFADTKKGNRPSFIKAGKPEMSQKIYDEFLMHIKNMGFKKVISGEFGADMQINLTNDGPVTIIIDTKEWKG